MPQTEITDMAIAVDGLLADTTMQKDCASAVNEDSAALPFGVMVAQGDADDGVVLPTATTDLLKGVVVFYQGYLRPEELDDDGLQPGVQLGVLRHGRIWVRPEDAVTPTSGVHVRRTSGGPSEQLGAFRGMGDGTDTIDCSLFCKWMTSADAGELAKLEIDMTMASTTTADS